MEAFVRINGEEINIDTLSSELRRKVGTQLALTYFNELFRGQAMFTEKS